jgi:hypothetical protein
MKTLKNLHKSMFYTALVALTSICFTIDSALALGDSNEVWISARTNAAGTGFIWGSGAITNPFYGDVSAVINALQTNTTIHLLPGIHYTSAGLTLKAGHRLLGAGIDTTIIRRNTYVGFNSDGVYSAADGAEVCDLTVDASGSSTNIYVNGGVVLDGNNSAIRRVKVINCSGDLANATEAIALAVGSSGGVGCEIIDCIATNFQADYTDGVGLSGQGIIKNNRVYDCLNGYLTSFSENGVFVNNLADRTGNGFYTDTGWETNLTIIGNTFRNVVNGINITKSGGHGWMVIGLSIKDNTIEIDRSVASNQWTLAINLWNQETSWVPWKRISIMGNTLHYFNTFDNSTTFPSSGCAVNLGASLITNFQNILITGNSIDRSFRLQGAPAWWAENMDLAGVPTHLSTIGSGSPGSVTLASTDGTVFVTSTGTTTIVLPQCAAWNGAGAPGHEVTIINNKSTGNIAVTPSGTDTLLPTNSVTILPKQSAKFICDGISTWAGE